MADERLQPGVTAETVPDLSVPAGVNGDSVLLRTVDDLIGKGMNEGVGMLAFLKWWNDQQRLQSERFETTRQQTARRLIGQVEAPIEQL